ncbi:MAG: RNase adapter RapZ [Acidimicrobiales bacterium]
MSEFVIVTGNSGAGRSTGANVLEDLGWFVIDNLPTELIEKVGELADAPGSPIGDVALGIPGGPSVTGMLDAINELRRAGNRVRIVFLEANTPTLVTRYESTRRRHPFGDSGLAEAIDGERAALQEVRAAADVVIDTSDLNVHELRQRLVDLFGAESPGGGMQTKILSFGYKHGLPLDVDLVLDCRFLPNPHWVDELRPLTGVDEPVRDYVLTQAITGEFLERIEQLLAVVMPAYVNEGKSYLSIAFGCTGGQHRSVAIAEEVGAILGRMGHESAVDHRDIGRASTSG